MAKRIHTFRRGAAERTADALEALGAKGSNLALLASLDLPVPPGFTIASTAWREAAATPDALPPALRADIGNAVAWLEKATGRVFDGSERPLLLAVRTSARTPIPGLAETVLDVGLNDRTVETLARELGDAGFAFRSYRRFIESFASLVFGIDAGEFEDIADAEQAAAGWAREPQMPAEWRRLVARYHEFIEATAGTALPQTPLEQLLGVVESSFASWRSPVARSFRAVHGIPENTGLAVTAHAMIFNERDQNSGTGRARSRDFATGGARLTGEFGFGGRNAVPGVAEGGAVRDLAGFLDGRSADAFPTDIEALGRYVARLEAHVGDAVEVDFMVGDSELFLLQSRVAKREPAEAVRIATGLVGDGVIDEEEAILRIDPASLDQLLHPAIRNRDALTVIGRGRPASPGAASGAIVFTPEAAQAEAAEGRAVILVRNETHPEDIHGMHVAEGVLTIRGGTTSHAAVVARGIGKPCVTGAGALRLDQAAGTLRAGDMTLHAGDLITIDGSSGEVILGAAELELPSLAGELAQLLLFADRARRMGVRTNAETPAEARAARAFGAEGIGLCRTEHMFFQGDRVPAMRRMILASDEDGRREALAELLPFQRSDFVELFEIMAGLPVTIRLLDPPLHEFLPKGEAEIAEVASQFGIEPRLLAERIGKLEEFNPMLGHRGCRLAISHPEIVDVQARAIFEAAIEAGERAGAAVVPEIMVPLVGLKAELDFVKARVAAMADRVMAELGRSIDYRVGTMIELPRAIVRADAIAEESDFFSFGTNDLTQTVFGISRDDAANFLPTYEKKGIVARDPFQSLDVEGVGELIALGVEKARRTRPDITLGVCGEQGGDPASISFFEQTGLDYVSCSPFRVPVARIAAAQAAIRFARSLKGPAAKARGRFQAGE
ncbi:pyruvate, phosphate dikinase [Aureimonas leprariae]|uniref:Pyruvate, phosphate dikinase n=1 Tax=Plantimonas leprariae TaxID=2615207 RepID=A0A7V7TW39_9HYPH|nr:pyruvate, phosphate dikinase [Aureimonas leprariae]KAB0679558.1 pyruvate, phosphate dikinase [Aureimonas leprariae]